MIKQLYRPRSTSHSESDEIAYSATLDKAKEYFKAVLKEQPGMQGKEYDDLVRRSINTFIEETKPVIEEMIQSDGQMNYKMLSIRLYEDINAFGPITEALRGKYTDIVCSGIGPGNLQVMSGMLHEVLKDSNGSLLYFKTVQEIEDVVNRLAYFDGNKRLNRRQPNLRCTTPQGYRLTAVDKSLSAPVYLPDGTRMQVPTFDIRMPSKEPLTLDDMVWKKRTLCPEIARALRILMSLDGIKMIYSGVPGSGKTTIMYEVARTLKNKSVVCIADTPEGDLWCYDEDGVSERMVKSWCPTDQEDNSGDTSRGTLENLFYTILSTKTDMIIMSEVRSVTDINVMLKVGVSGKAMFTTMHGEDAISTAERCIKDIMTAKSCSRSEAIMEMILSVNVIVGMYHEPTDHTVRLGYISELVTYETTTGISLKEHRIFEFRRTAGKINEDTGKIKSNYCKIGIPTKKLMAYMDVTAMEQDDRAFLLEEATPEKPIVYKEAWWQ